MNKNNWITQKFFSKFLLLCDFWSNIYTRCLATGRRKFKK